MSRKAKAKAGGKAEGSSNKAASNETELSLPCGPDEDFDAVIAENVLGPIVRHAMLAGSFAGQIMAKDLRPALNHTKIVVNDHARAAASGDLKIASKMLMAQALSLDAIFAEMARRSSLNMGEYLDASERYMRMALKAQSNCRSTIEALAKLHQPREQTVRHVHVNDGGQAIVADEFHQHTGGSGNGKAVEQSHGPCAAAPSSTALPGPESPGQSLPMPRARRPKAVSSARRKSGSAAGK